MTTSCRTIVWTAMLVLVGVAAGACASLTGLDSFSKCSTDCDASIVDDAILDTSDGGEDVVMLDAAEPPPAADVVSVDATPSPSGDAGDAGDAGDVGCTEMTSVANCGACGRSCNASTGTPSCNGSTCTYACNANRHDCNAGSSPDTDGCECPGTACCGVNCQTAHTNGVGQNFYDCVAPGTHNQAQATAACAAYTGSASACTHKQSMLCGCNGTCGSLADSMCGSASGTTYCWQYSGPNYSGTVQAGGTAGYVATCGSATDPTWN